MLRAFAVALSLLWANVAHATSPTLDGSNTAQYTGTSGTISLTTTLTNDVICLFTNGYKFPTGPSPTVTSITGGSLTFTARKTITGATGSGGVQFFAMEVWCAPSAATQTSVTFTFNLASSAGQGEAVIYGVNGANDITNAFDPNVSLPASNQDLTGSSTLPSVTGVSTTRADDLLFEFFGCINVGCTVSSNGSGWTSIGSVTNSASGATASYKSVSATQSSVTFPFTGNSNDWTTIGDAITADAPPGAGPPGFRALLGVGK